MGMTETKRAVGRYGVWSVGLCSPDPALRGEIAETAAELEELGYGTLWLGGSPAVQQAVPVVAATSRITVATGILSIWQHEAAEVAEAHAALAAAHPGRFLLGLGVSHAHLADAYRQPYSAMVAYLDALDAARTPVPAERRVLAALGPKMLGLSRDRGAGAHPYLVSPEHTAHARSLLGEAPLLAPELKVVLETDAERARTIARDYLGFYLPMPNYTNNLLRLGFTEDDFLDGGSDRLIDTVFAWGDQAAVRRRIDEFHAAGADHVALQIVNGEGPMALTRPEWRRLAEALT